MHLAIPDYRPNDPGYRVAAIETASETRSGLAALGVVVSFATLAIGVSMIVASEDDLIEGLGLFLATIAGAAISVQLRTLWAWLVTTAGGIYRPIIEVVPMPVPRDNRPFRTRANELAEASTWKGRAASGALLFGLIGLLLSVIV